MSNKNNSSTNKSNIALTFGLGAALGAATYYLFNSAFSEETPHRSGRARSRSLDGTGQNTKWRENGGRPDTCSICLEQIPAMSARTLLGCGHEFHTTCIEPWVQRNSNCPVCRSSIQ